MKIKVNDAEIYYEKYGVGLPIILLHGNQETHEIFDKLIEKLKLNYEVYAIDSRCHGKSENTKEISYDLMCEDVIRFIKKLNIKKPIIYGFSDGGIVGLLVSIKEPNILKKLVISGANATPDALKKKDLFFMKLVYLFTKSKYVKMMLKEPNISVEDLNNIQIPVHILVGKNDAIKIEHTKLINNSIKDSTLEIIENENHGSYIVHSEKIYNILKKYI